MSRKARMRGMILALLVGVLTLVLAWSGGRKPVPETAVLVALRQVPSGQTLVVADVGTELLEGRVPSGYLTHRRQAVGRTLAHGVVAGQPLFTADFTQSTLKQGLRQGEVGVFVPVTLASSAEVVPGDYVDVFSLGSSTSGTSTGPTAVVEHARVVSVLSSSGAPVAQTSGGSTLGSYAASVPSAVELAAPEANASALASVASSGTLWLALDPWNAFGAASASQAVPFVGPNRSQGSSMVPLSSSGRSRSEGAKNTPGASRHQIKIK